MADIFDINEHRDFADRQIAVVLSGSEWVAFLGRTINRPLSESGQAVYRVAAGKVCEQLGSASDECLKSRRLK